MRRVIWTGLWAVACVACVACGGGGDPDTLAVARGLDSVEVAMGKRGGVMELRGNARVTVRSDALSKEIMMRTRTVDPERLVRLGDQVEGVGKAIEVTPHGLRLKRPATIEQVVRSDAPASELRVLRLSDPDDTEWEQLRDVRVLEPGERDENSELRDADSLLLDERRVVFEVDRFSYFWPVRLRNDACADLEVGDVCRKAAGECDAAETCDGQSDACPEDAKLGADSVCREAAGGCDAAETCDGESDACPEDSPAAADTVCREAATLCDVAETCDGESFDCPEDGFADDTTECRPAAGLCDVAELCSGSSSVCPEDTFEDAGTVCETGTTCLPSATCSGTAAVCPARVAAQAGTECDDGLYCTETSSCDGSGACVGSGDPCASNLGDDDADCSESCVELAGAYACTGNDPAGSYCEPTACSIGSCDASGACAEQVQCPVFVDGTNGADVAGCGSAWGDAACATVQFGSDRASGSNNPRVFVLAGTYSAGLGQTVLAMAGGVEYYGGFSDPAQQHPDERVFSPKQATVLQSAPSKGPGDPVVTGATAARLDGFTVQSGYALAGAGMYNNGVDNLTVANTRFYGNQAYMVGSGATAAGGAMYNSNASDIALESVRFDNNQAYAPLGKARGGAVYNTNVTNLTLTDTTFGNNGASGSSSARGGAMYSTDLDGLMIDGVVAKGNHAGSSGDTRGGALYNQSCLNVQVEGSQFSLNHVDTNGAGRGGAIANLGSDTTLVDVEFSRNYARASGSAIGGGLCDASSNSDLTNVRFEGNQIRRSDGFNFGRGAGYAIEAASAGQATLTDVSFVDNVFSASATAANGAYGGGLYAVFSGKTTPLLPITGATFRGNSVRGGSGKGSMGGGGALISGADVELRDVRFQDNTVNGFSGTPAGGGLWLSGGNLDGEDVDFLGNVVSGDFDTAGIGGGAYVEGTGEVTLTNVSFADNAAAPMGSGSSGNAGGGLYIRDGSATTPPAYTLTNVTLFENSPDALFVATADRVGRLENTALQGALAGTAPGTQVATCNLTAGDVVRSADGFPYLSDDGAAKCGNGDDALADGVFSVDWRTLTTRLNGTLDEPQVDQGRHYDPTGLRIRSFTQGVSADDVVWDVVGPAGTACSLWGDKGVEDALEAPGEIAGGTGSIPHAVTDAVLRCQLGGVVVQASVPPPVLP